MAIIDLDISDLTQIYNNLRKVETDLEVYYREVSDILNTLNLKVAARKNIDDNLEDIKKYLKKESAYIGQCARYVNSVIDSFKAGDSVSGHLPEYSFSVSNVSSAGEGVAIPICATLGTPDPVAEIEKICLRMTEQAEQIFAESLNSSTAAETADYIEILQQARTGLK